MRLELFYSRLDDRHASWMREIRWTRHKLRSRSVIDECNGRQGKRPNAEILTPAGQEWAGRSHFAAFAVTPLVRGSCTWG
jgi:hypothetical protein